MEPLRPEDPAGIGGYPSWPASAPGGMGQVYLGLTGGGRHVAIKVIREDFEGPQALARFRREVATVERVRSRFAAAMVGAGLEAPPYWLATEYVPGPTLRQAVAEHGPLPPETCVRLLGALAQGLLEIHRQNVQHRDLKPGNVILAPDGPRLIDFGIARGEGQTQITQTGAWNGTPGYVAPEVVREQEPRPASDVFSLAGTIAYAATGRPPFGGGRIEAIIHRTLDGEIDLDGVDSRVADLVRPCAERDPADRITLERLLQLAAPSGPVTGDPFYQRVVGVPRPMPASVADAAASGLVPPEHTRTGPGAGRGRSSAAVIAAGAAVAAVVLGARSSRGSPSTATTRAVPRAAPARPTGAVRRAVRAVRARAAARPRRRPDPRPGRPPAGRDPREAADHGLPDHAVLREGLHLPAGGPARGPGPRQRPAEVRAAPPVTGKTVDLSMRFKYAKPSGYYVAAEIRPPAEQQGNGVTGVVKSKPHLVPRNNEDVNLRYPADFQWEGSGNGTYPLVKGVWTVIWMHVHPNGDAYFMACDGFTVA